MSLMNGVDSEEIIAEEIGAHIASGCDQSGITQRRGWISF